MVVNEISLTKSITMGEATIHSTPIQNKRVDNNDKVMDMMQLLLHKFEVQNNNFNELKGEIKEIKGDIKQYKEQNVKFENLSLIHI